MVADLVVAARRPLTENTVYGSLATPDDMYFLYVAALSLAETTQELPQSKLP